VSSSEAVKSYQKFESNALNLESQLSRSNELEEDERSFLEYQINVNRGLAREVLIVNDFLKGEAKIKEFDEAGPRDQVTERYQALLDLKSEGSKIQNEISELSEEISKLGKLTKRVGTPSRDVQVLKRTIDKKTKRRGFLKKEYHLNVKEREGILNALLNDQKREKLILSQAQHNRDIERSVLARLAKAAAILSGIDSLANEFSSGIQIAKGLNSNESCYAKKIQFLVEMEEYSTSLLKALAKDESFEMEEPKYNGDLKWFYALGGQRPEDKVKMFERTRSKKLESLNHQMDKVHCQIQLGLK